MTTDIIVLLRIMTQHHIYTFQLTLARWGQRPVFTMAAFDTLTRRVWAVLRIGIVSSTGVDHRLRLLKMLVLRWGRQQGLLVRGEVPLWMLIFQRRILAANDTKLRILILNFKAILSRWIIIFTRARILRSAYRIKMIILLLLRLAR